MSWFPYDHWETRAAELARLYHAATPFPHIRLVEFLDPVIAQRLELEFPSRADEGWTHVRHFNEDRYVWRRGCGVPPTMAELIATFEQPRFLDWLSLVTGMPGLQGDATLTDGGLRQVERHGYVNLHTKSLAHHDRPTWRRRCTLVLFFNSGWDETWGGSLELWNREVTHRAMSYPPLANHAVIFDTTEHSFHGQPRPLDCPSTATSKSLVMHYYVEEPAPVPARPIVYRAAPDDSFPRRTGIWLDNRLGRGLAGQMAGRVLNFLRRS